MAYKIAIDSGHGSNTSGKRHPDGYREHYSNTYTAFYLDQILKKNGFETLKVSWDDANAKDDSDVSLSARQAQIKAANCDATISIHANAHGTGSSYTAAEGIETYYHSSNGYCKNSKKLAEAVQNELVKGTKQVNRGVKRAAFAMCNCKAMDVNAAILIEMAFMTNKKESELLKSDAYCRETAKEIAQGIFNYYGVKGNVNVSLTSAIKSTESTKKEETTKTEEKKTTTSSTTTKKEETVNTTIKAGKSYKLSGVAFYSSSTAKTASSKKSGTYYVWSTEVINGRIRMTNSKSNVGKTGKVSGWVNVSDIVKNTTPITAGAKFKLSNTSFYVTSSTKIVSAKKSGTYYVWSTEVINGRIRMTNSKSNVGKTGQITGWVNVSDL